MLSVLYLSSFILTTFACHILVFLTRPGFSAMSIFSFWFFPLYVASGINLNILVSMQLLRVVH